MTRKQAYDGVQGEYMKFLYLYGAMCYDEKTACGAKPLSLEDAAKLDTQMLEAIMVFQSELMAASSDDIAASDKATHTSVCEILGKRDAWHISTDPPLTPSYHGENCLGNGEHPDYECCCDECNFYLECFPDYKDMME